ncbi:hypothetical protein DMENIID0001_106680 [Sergentomyia squamirostris]
MACSVCGSAERVIQPANQPLLDYLINNIPEYKGGAICFSCYDGVKVRKKARRTPQGVNDTLENIVNQPTSAVMKTTYISSQLFLDHHLAERSRTQRELLPSGTRDDQPEMGESSKIACSVCGRTENDELRVIQTPKKPLLEYLMKNIPEYKGGSICFSCYERVKKARIQQDSSSSSSGSQEMPSTPQSSGSVESTSSSSLVLERVQRVMRSRIRQYSSSSSQSSGQISEHREVQLPDPAIPSSSTLGLSTSGRDPTEESVSTAAPIPRYRRLRLNEREPNTTTAFAPLPDPAHFQELANELRNSGFSANDLPRNKGG